MKVLIIEDDTFFQKFYSTKLKEIGYEVIVASDGVEGLQKIQQENPNIILLDVIMPKMNGFDVLKTLSQDQLHNHIPVLIFTTLEDEKDLDEAKKLGAVDYINKSISDFNSSLAKITKYVTK